MGKVDVYSDDVLVLDDFDLYSGPTQTQFLVYEANNLRNTTHTLRIVNTGLRNPSATQNYVNIDYLVHRLGNYIVSPLSNSVLPITLLDFSGKADLNQIVLNWQTTNEINNSHFEVEKFEEKIGFKSIGRVDAKKEPSSLNNYTFVDTKPNIGSNYYQLKQYDFDGKSSTSKTIEVKFGLNNPFTVYPNPVKVGDDINILSLNFDNQLDIQLVDMNQRVVLKKQITEPQNRLNLSTKGLLPGVYILILNTGKQQFYNKVIIVP
jgi:hypothetical protein